MGTLGWYFSLKLIANRRADADGDVRKNPEMRH